MTLGCPWDAIARHQDAIVIHLGGTLNDTGMPLDAIAMPQDSIGMHLVGTFNDIGMHLGNTWKSPAATASAVSKCHINSCNDC